MDFRLTNDEISSIEKYQDNDFKIINTLLRKGIESEVRINSRNGKDYPFMTKDRMKQTLNDIKNLYSAIIKSYIKNGSQKFDKKLYRGTKQSLIKTIDNSNSSFLSTTTNIFQTMTFSRSFNKNSNVADESERAVFLIDGEVPYINMENEFGGGEAEILFVPAKIEIKEAQLTSNQKFGKEYIMKLSEIDIPEKTHEEIENLENEILAKTEKMSNYLKYILTIKDNPNFNQNPRTLATIEEYSQWKELVIEYNYQQYRIIKNKLMSESISQKNSTQTINNNQYDLRHKVEQEHFMNPTQTKEETVPFHDSLKQTIANMQQRGFDMPDFNDLFQEQPFSISEKEDIEEIENTERRIM